MNKLKNKIGMTMAELLIVVAIISVLGGVAFIAVWNYQRSLGQLERDGIAKEIFVAAQNHLTVAYGEGYLGTTDYGVQGTADEDAGKEIYYYAVNGNISGASALSQMLPFGSIDETVRSGGSYIVRYQKDAGLVLDVFYCTRSDSPEQYNYQLTDGDYASVLELRDTDTDNNKQERRNWNNHILGWYGGAEAAMLATTTLKAPTINVYNKEKLYVEVSNPNSSNNDASLKLIITGEDSKAQKAYELVPTSSEERVKHNQNDYTVYTVFLDDVTTSGMHFGNIDADTEKKFIPGENITIQAVAYSTSALANIAYSTKSTTNSLFDGISKAKDIAYIGNIRHLENLDKLISNLDKNDDEEKLKIQQAEQIDSFSWIEFQKEIRKTETKSTIGTASEYNYESVGIYSFSGTYSGNGNYMPIEPNYNLVYNGKSHSVSDVTVESTENKENAGLFGSISSVSAISNLELIDFSITGTTSAGALAGTLNDCTVTNVLARNSAGASGGTITAPTAGGLAGITNSGTTVQYSAAAMIVSGSASAGGLIGNASGEVTGCYSGGHTKSGSYEEWVGVETNPYDVTGGIAGGLVGTTSATIADSYSTCSVSGTTMAGGFAGNAPSGLISNCYATGYIDEKAATKFAFVAAGSATLSGNYYYQVINEVPSTKQGAKDGETEPMLPVSGYELNVDNMSRIKPLDLNAESYNSFVGQWEDWNLARAFDAALVKYYSGSYTLKTVDELNSAGYDKWDQLFVTTHYGDWPSPEVFFINEATGGGNAGNGNGEAGG